MIIDLIVFVAVRGNWEIMFRQNSSVRDESDYPLTLSNKVAVSYPTSILSLMTRTRTHIRNTHCGTFVLWRGRRRRGRRGHYIMRRDASRGSTLRSVPASWTLHKVRSQPHNVCLRSLTRNTNFLRLPVI